MKITKDTKPAEIPELAPCSELLMYKCRMEDRPVVQMSFQEMVENQPTWNRNSMMRGIEHLQEAVKGKPVFYRTYSEEEISRDPEKADVGVFFLPAEGQFSKKPFIVCCSGGGYSCVCSIVESFPVAAVFNELGYHVFVLNYRVSDHKTCLMPKPLEDLAVSVRYILDRREQFGIRNTEYVVNGYSAGGNLTVLYGMESKGYKSYGLPRPKALFPIYPVISTSTEYMQEGSGRDDLLSTMFGPGWREDEIKEYNLPENMTENYPPCYIVAAKDDNLVDPKNSEDLKRMLDRYGIPAALEMAEFGGHGWGDGNGSGAAGWPYRAIHFLEHL